MGNKNIACGEMSFHDKFDSKTNRVSNILTYSTIGEVILYESNIKLNIFKLFFYIEMYRSSD